MVPWNIHLLEFKATHKPVPDTAKTYIATTGSPMEKVSEAQYTAISAECRTLKEIETEADRLIDELKRAKKKAAKFFKNEEQKRRKS